MLHILHIIYHQGYIHSFLVRTNNLVSCLYIIILNPCFLINLQNFIQEKESNDPDSDDMSSEDYYDAEILDKMTTNRGELKLRTVSRNNSKSFSYNSSEDMQH